jgi:hypothetical protein
MVLSALPPKAEVCGATSDVCFGPITDICPMADDFICLWRPARAMNNREAPDGPFVRSAEARWPFLCRMIWTACQLRTQITARAYFLLKTGRPILPATSFFRPDARQVLYAIIVAMPRDGATY